MRSEILEIQDDYRYGFNGMERDDEVKGSGNHYTTLFRQYDPRLGRWFSIDPVVHPFSSPYVAFSNRPITNTDPFGDCDDCPNEAEALQAKTEAGNVSHGEVWKDKNGNTMEFDQDLGWLPSGNNPTDNTSPVETGVEWLTGEGPREHNFTSGDPFLELLRQHDYINDVKSGIVGDINNLNVGQEYDANYSLDGFGGVPKYLRDYSTLATGGQTGNLAVTYLGSYNLTYKVTDVDVINKTARVQFNATNASTIESATHPPVIGYTEFWSENIGQPLNRAFSTGSMSRTQQNFNWSETIKLE